MALLAGLVGDCQLHLVLVLLVMLLLVYLLLHLLLPLLLIVLLDLPGRLPLLLLLTVLTSLHLNIVLDLGVLEESVHLGLYVLLVLFYLADLVVVGGGLVDRVGVIGLVGEFLHLEARTGLTHRLVLALLVG